MAGNTIGEAWVSIRPDMTGFTAALTAGVTQAIASAQAVADAHPINLKVALDSRDALMQLAALQAIGNIAKPITLQVGANVAPAIAEIAALRVAADAAGGGAAGGVVVHPLESSGACSGAAAA